LTTISNKAAGYLSLLVAAILLAISSCQKPAQTTTPSIPSPQNKNTQPAYVGPAGYPAPILNKPYAGTGEVVIVNRQEGWIEINHEDIPGLMPAMQMEFWVQNKTLLDGVKPGDRVNFTIVETSKGEFLTELKRP
jgi:Cu/Ag efflux protein CusF